MEGTHGTELEIRQEERGTAGAFFIEEGGRRLAELSYTRSPHAAVLVHTEVSSALQGRGVGRRLVERAVEWARATGTKLIPVCTYAKSVLDRSPELRDVLR